MSVSSRPTSVSHPPTMPAKASGPMAPSLSISGPLDTPKADGAIPGDSRSVVVLRRSPAPKACYLTTAAIRAPMRSYPALLAWMFASWQYHVSVQTSATALGTVIVPNPRAGMSIFVVLVSLV